MTWGMLVAVPVLLAAGGDATYAEAHRVSTETGRPLVVMVGAEWCPACRVMKSDILPRVEESGALEGVAFAFVDYDEETKLARQFISGGPIPQLLMYRRAGKEWRVRRLVGQQSVEKVEGFLAEGLRRDRRSRGSQTAAEDGSYDSKRVSSRPATSRRAG